MNKKLILLYKSPRNEFENKYSSLVESTKDYIDELVKFTLANQQKLVDEQFRKHFFDNLLTEMTEQGNLSLWTEFQAANQENKVFSFELVLKGIDFAQGKLSEKDLTDRLEEPISKLALEVVKQTKDVELFCPYNYDPRVELAEEIDFKVSKDKVIETFDSWEKEVCSEHRIYVENTDGPIYDIYRELKNLEKRDLEVKNLEKKITLFDAQSNYFYILPWIERKTLESEQKEEASHQIEERKKLAFVEHTKKLLCTTNSNLTVEGAEKISDYTEALAQFIEENKKNLANPFFRQDFFENFALYIPFKEKNLLLGKEFQEVSRTFKEFHLENILQETDFIDGKHQTPYIKRLNHEMKRMAVEVAKKNPNMTLFYRYDQQLFKNRELEDFSCEFYKYRRFTEKLVSFLDNWKGSVESQERQMIFDEVTKFHDLYHNHQEIKNQVFFLDNKNQVVSAPWERNSEWEDAEKPLLTKADSSTLESLLTAPSEDKRTQLFDYMEIKKMYMDKISQRCEEKEKASLTDIVNQSQNLQGNLGGAPMSQREKEQKNLCRLDISTYKELQTKALRENNRLKEESTTKQLSERKLEKGSRRNLDEDKLV